MGEIIFSICVGGFLVVGGLIMLFVLGREERRISERSQGKTPENNRNS